MSRNNEILELIAVISASLSVIVASFAVWKGVSSIFRRLVITQNKITSLYNLFTVEQARSNDMEHFLAVSHGYNVRESYATIVKAINENYNSEDTGF